MLAVFCSLLTSVGSGSTVVRDRNRNRPCCEAIVSSAPARLRPVIQLAVKAGWTYSESSKGHPQLVPPPGLLDPYRQNRPAAPITFTKTPSEPRADTNAIVVLRRLGVPIPRKGVTSKKR